MEYEKGYRNTDLRKSYTSRDEGGTLADIKAKDTPTHILMNKSVDHLWEGVLRLERVLDSFEAEGKIREDVPTVPTENMSIVNTWKMTPEKMGAATKKLHGLIDRLENIFS